MHVQPLRSTSSKTAYHRTRGIRALSLVLSLALIADFRNKAEISLNPRKPTKILSSTQSVLRFVYSFICFEGIKVFGMRWLMSSQPGRKYFRQQEAEKCLQTFRHNSFRCSQSFLILRKSLTEEKSTKNYKNIRLGVSRHTVRQSAVVFCHRSMSSRTSFSTFRKSQELFIANKFR